MVFLLPNARAVRRLKPVPLLQIRDRLYRHGALITKSAIKNWSQDRRLHACTPPMGSKRVMHVDDLKCPHHGGYSETDTKAICSGLA